jgi:hypothetical protein
MTMNRTDIQRRALIAGGAAAAGLGAFAAPARAARLASAAGAAGGDRRLATAGFADWQAATGALFAAETEAGTVGLRLVRVEAFHAPGTRPADLGRAHAFAATFEAAVGVLPQGNCTYRLTSGRFAPMHVYFDPAGAKIRAIFN